MEPNAIFSKPHMSYNGVRRCLIEGKDMVTSLIMRRAKRRFKRF